MTQNGHKMFYNLHVLRGQKRSLLDSLNGHQIPKTTCVGMNTALYIRTCSLICLQVGVKHIILAVSYRAELLEQEMKQQEQRVSHTTKPISAHATYIRA